MRRYNRELLANCAAAERALVLATQRTGYLVRGTDIVRAWPDANGRAPIPKVLHERRWTRALGPAIAAGRVTVARRGRTTFLGPLTDPPLSLPPELPLPRAFGTRVLERCALAERALGLAVREHGTMVRGEQIAGAWPRATGQPLPTHVASRWDRALEPAITAGRVRVERHGGHVYYAAADANWTMPTLPTDLMRVEEAVRRAVARHRSAVPADIIASEIAHEPELAPASRATPLGSRLATLVRCGRVRKVRPPGKGRKARVYYTTPDGPKWIRTDVETDTDRRLRAVRLLWRAAGGRPFSTSAVRRYVESRDSLRIANDLPYGWTNALHALAAAGLVVRIADPVGRFVRWAPAAEWRALRQMERTRRLHDTYGRASERSAPSRHGPEASTESRSDCADVPDSTGDAVTQATQDAARHDVNFVSRNRDVALLTRLAQHLAAAAESDSEHRRILEERPVTAAQVRCAARRRPALFGGARDVRLALLDAARLRAGMRRSAVVVVGRVGRTTYYTVQHRAAARAFVEFLRALAAPEVSRIGHSFAELRAAAEMANSHILPIPDCVIEARAQAALFAAHGRAEQLRTAMDNAALLPEERSRGEAVVRDLEMLMVDACCVLRAAGAAPDPQSAVALSAIPDNALIDIAAAWEEITGLVSYSMVQPRHLAARLHHLVPVVRRSSPTCAEREPTAAAIHHGRHVETYFDRVAFACYVCLRWGGATSATTAARAKHALGELRVPGPFIAALGMPEARAGHGSAAAALGILDDAGSRTALATYLSRSLGERKNEGDTTATAAATAAYGLAPLPCGGLARALAEHERRALERAAADHQDLRVRVVSRRVLRAWREHWSRDQLLYL